jgi:hypothetical protein
MLTLTADPVPSSQLHDREKSLEIYGYHKQMLYSLIRLQVGTVKDFHSPQNYKIFIF